MSEGKLIFIVGVGRSGTTLIQSMLNAHPEICFTPESHFVKKYLVPRPESLVEGKLSSNKIIDLLNQDEEVRRMGVPVEEVVSDEVVSGANPLARIFHKMLLAYATKSGKANVGDKDPLNVGYLPLLKSAYPEAYIIHIIRDPRDVVLSRIKTEWGKSQLFSQHVADYHFHLKKAIEEGPDLFGEKYIEILYEQLTKEPELVLRKVSEMLGVEYSSEMLNYHQKANQIVTESEMKWKGNVFKPIIKDNIAKWKKGLTHRQVMKIEGGLEHVFHRFGYQLSGYGNAVQRKVLSLPIKVFEMLYKLKAIKDRTS